MQINSAIPSQDYILAFRQLAEKSEGLKTESFQNSTVADNNQAMAERFSDLQMILAKHEITLNFSRDSQTNEIIIRMFHEQTGEIVRQIPTEISLKLAAIYKQWQARFQSQRD